MNTSLPGTQCKQFIPELLSVSQSGEHGSLCVCNTVFVYFSSIIREQLFGVELHHPADN